MFLLIFLRMKQRPGKRDFSVWRQADRGQITMTVSKLDSMRYNSHIEDCLQAVAAAAEYETDIYLIQMVKLQKIVEEIRVSGLYNDSSLKGPVGMYVRSFQTALQEYKSALPANLQQNSQYHQVLSLMYHKAYSVVSSSVSTSTLFLC
jgi:hypothetical protein